MSLSHHCHRLVQFFQYADPYNENPICDWFQIAGGIKSVEYFSALSYDESVDWCRPAYDYEVEKSEFHQKLIKQLTIFTYIYSGFELFLDTLDLEPCPAYRGKIHSASYFLKRYFDPYVRKLDFYSGLMVFYKAVLTKSPWYEAATNLGKDRKCAGLSSEGLAIVYDVRNQFAHGTFRFLDPDEYSSTKSYDIPIVAASSRILLLTMQMMLQVKFKDADFRIGGSPFFNEDDDLDDDETMSSSAFLQTMHIKVNPL